MPGPSPQTRLPIAGVTRKVVVALALAAAPLQAAEAAFVLGDIARRQGRLNAALASFAEGGTRLRRIPLRTP